MNLKKTLYKYKYVSFDMFDTIIYRSVEHPTDIFDIVEEKLVKKYGLELKGFSKIRKETALSLYKTSEKEVALRDIYASLPYEDSIKEFAENVEIATECECVRPNFYMQWLINELQNAGKKIIIISDMYLPKKCLIEMLNKASIPYDDLFVSVDFDARKSNGKLYDVVCEHLNIKKAEWIHIGDNRRSDFLIPKFKGLHSKQWKPNSGEFFHCGICNTELRKLLREYSDSNYGKYVGYTMFGPLLYGFCQWIRDTVSKQDDIDEVCFLARDGQIVKKAYDIMYGTNVQYLLASRRSLTVPLLINAHSMQDIISFVPYIKREEHPKELLHKIGIEDRNLEEILVQKYGTSISRSDLAGKVGDEFYELIKDSMVRNAAEEYKAAVQYLKNNLKPGKVALVDIGWYGTMQHSMQKLCSLAGLESLFCGLYLGLLYKESLKDLEAYGYVYDYHDENQYDAGLIYGFNGLLELMFTADHGSAKKYVFQNEAICECESDVGEYSDFVCSVQTGALNFVSDIKGKGIHLDIKEAYFGLHQLLSSPSERECEMLGELEFFDAYTEKLIQYDGWIELLRHPKKMLRKFLRSNWKIGFLREMIPTLPPSYVYKGITKLKG